MIPTANAIVVRSFLVMFVSLSGWVWLFSTRRNMMDLCIAGRRVSGEVNLADRSGFNYPLLIGRNMLGDAAITIDSREIFASKRACPEN